MNEQELLDALNEANAKLTKIETEVKERDAVQDSKIAALELALENGNALSPEVVDALNALKSNLQKVDDINEDAAATDQATNDAPPPPPVKDGVTSQSEEIV